MKALLPTIGAAILIGMIAPMALPPRHRMARAVQDFGFTDVQVTSFALLGCPEHDTYRQHWSGRNRRGQPVSGTVCGGPLESWSVHVS